MPSLNEGDAGRGEEQGAERSLVEIRLRPMTAADLDRVEAIERASFTNPWKKRTFRNLLGRDGTELWVAELPDGGIAGYLVLWFAADEGELADLAVAEGYRGRGLGAHLLDHAVELARSRGVGSLFLEVRFSNKKAEELYRSRGFRVVTVRREYYREPTEDALVMLKSLW